MLWIMFFITIESDYLIDAFGHFIIIFYKLKYKKPNNVLKKNGLIYCMQLFDLYHLQITLFPNKTWPNTKT